MVHGVQLHHVSITTKDLKASTAFYGDVLGLEQVARPSFPLAGAWFRTGTLEIHLIERPAGTFRPNPLIDADDVHFAIRVADFEAMVRDLMQKGYGEDGEDRKRLLVKRNSMAGYPQVYLIDPDNHVIEINAARL
jgi:glyoxylase I family protein